MGLGENRLTPTSYVLVYLNLWPGLQEVPEMNTQTAQIEWIFLARRMPFYDSRGNSGKLRTVQG